MSIKFIYSFDIGGVLVNTSSGFSTISKLSGLADGKIVEDFYDKFAKELDSGRASPEELNQAFIKEFKLKLDSSFDFLESFYKNFKPIKVTHDLVLEVCSKYKVGLLSDISQKVFDGIWKNNFIPHIDYSAKIKSYEVGAMKPDEKIYLEAQKKSGFKPEELLFIDDKEKNLKQAKAMGWQTYLFNTKKSKESVSEIKIILDL
jgi:glucose-1-phosphatase